MRIKLDDNGYIQDYALIGIIPDSQEFDIIPKDIEDFKENYHSYKIIDGTFHKDIDYAVEIQLENQKDILRSRREKECFSYINRGSLWYNKLNEEQKNELQTWYDEWLNITDTFTIPTKPEWLENK